MKIMRGKRLGQSQTARAHPGSVGWGLCSTAEEPDPGSERASGLPKATQPGRDLNSGPALPSETAFFSL